MNAARAAGRRTRGLMLAAALGVAGGWLAGCSAPARLSELSDADAAEQAGDDEAALRAYRAATVSCRQERSDRRRRELCADAQLGAARTLERLGRTAEAAAAYAAIPAALDSDPPPSAAASFKAGQLYLRLGEEKRAWDLLWAAIATYPDQPHAADAVKLLLRDGRGRNPRALADAFGTLLGRLGPRPAAAGSRRTDDEGEAPEGSSVADNLLWSLADLHEHELDDPAGALAYLDRIPSATPDSGLRDDAWWNGARLARQLGDSKGAARRLRSLLATREVAWGMGSYFSEWLDDAQLELGRILRDDLGDSAGAAASFRRLPKDYPASVLHDDALFELALTLDRAGDAPGTCTALGDLAKRWPDSKYRLGRAQELAAHRDCGGAAAAPARAEAEAP